MKQGNALSLMKGWEIKKLRDVILEIKDGGTPSRTKPEYFGGDVSWCVVKDISPEIYSTRENLTELGLSKCSAKVWPINSVIISLGATIGQVGIAKIPVATKQGISGIIVNQTLLKPELLVYYLNFQKDFIQRAATGATIKEVRPSKLADILDFPLPPISEQHRIVAILDDAFAKIGKAKANAEQNLKNAKELFDCVLNSILKDKKWEVKELGEVCSKVEYGSSTKSATEGEIPVLRMGNIQNGRFTWDDLVYSDNKEDNKQYLLKFNDVLFNRTNSPALVGKTAIYKSEMPAIFAGYLIRLHRKEDLIDADFLNYYLNSKIANDYGKTVVISSVNQANINGTKLKTYPIPIPSLKEQQTIVQKLDGLSAETKKLEAIYQQKINDLEELKKSVLQKAFSGELKTAKALV